MLTEKQLREIEARLPSYLRLPLFEHTEGPGIGNERTLVSEQGGEIICIIPVGKSYLASFFACAPADIRALLDEARELRALAQVSDEELIAEVQRRGYWVHCPEILCPECGTMCSVLPREAGQTIVCDFCGERFDAASFLSAQKKEDGAENHPVYSCGESEGGDYCAHCSDATCLNYWAWEEWDEETPMPWGAEAELEADS